MGSAAFRIVGHRGAMALEPENTMRSLRRGESLGVDAVELDVWLSRDGHLVVMHDATLDRTTDGTGEIADVGWEQIQTLDAGQGERVPDLDMVCRQIHRTGLQVEVKTPDAAEAVVTLLREQCADRDDITISSFSVDCVRTVLAGRRPEETWTVGLICGAKDADKLQKYADLGMDQLMVNWALSDLGPAQEYRRSGYATVWQCRTATDVEHAIDEGWAGTTLDDPRIGLAVRSERGLNPSRFRTR